MSGDSDINTKIRVAVNKQVTSNDVYVVYMSQEEYDEMQAIEDLHDKAEYAVGLGHALLDEESVVESALQSIEIGIEGEPSHQVLSAEDEPAHGMVMG